MRKERDVMDINTPAAAATAAKNFTPAPKRWRVRSNKVVGPARLAHHVAIGDVICDPEFASLLRSSGAALEEIA